MEMSTKNQQRTESVRIFGEEFRIASDNDVDIRKVAGYVDRRMAEVAARSGGRQRAQLAVLAAMEIAAELLRARWESEVMFKKACDNVDRLRTLVDERSLLPLTSEWIEQREETSSY